MQVIIFDREDVGDSSVKQISVEDLVSSKTPSDKKIAFVSVANSLLFMDGGSDLGYMNAFENIQQKCQKGARVLGNKSLLGRPCLMIGNALGFELEPNVFFYFCSHHVFTSECSGY